MHAWILHEEKEGYKINEQTVSRNLQSLDLLEQWHILSTKVTEMYCLFIAATGFGDTVGNFEVGRRGGYIGV